MPNATRAATSAAHGQRDAPNSRSTRTSRSPVGAPAGAINVSATTCAHSRLPPLLPRDFGARSALGVLGGPNECRASFVGPSCTKKSPASLQGCNPDRFSWGAGQRSLAMTVVGDAAREAASATVRHWYAHGTEQDATDHPDNRSRGVAFIEQSTCRCALTAAASESRASLAVVCHCRGSIRAASHNRRRAKSDRGRDR